MMKLLKILLNTIILSLFIALTTLAVNNFFPGIVEKSSVSILLISFFILSLFVLLIIYAGSGKNSETQTVYSLAAIGAKFMLSAVIALVYFEAFKKIGLNNIILFFVLYLTFTVYLLVVIVKDLNIRSLKRG